MRTACVLFGIAAALALLAAPASAIEIVGDEYWVIVDTSGGVVDGGGSGFNGGEWYYYQNTGWWNQWFYNAPFSWDRWKEIDVFMEVLPILPDAYGEITINWSSPEWPSGPMVPPSPPLPPLTPEEEERYIRRLDPPLYAGPVTEPFIIELSDIIIPDYNPEWVSIDVRGYGFGIGWGDGAAGNRRLCGAASPPATLMHSRAT